MADDEVTDLKTALAEIDRDLAEIKNKRRGSRMVEEGADPDLVRHIAAGGTKNAFRGGERHERVARPGGGSGGRSLAKAIMDVRDHRTDHMTPVWADKALAESTDTAGGFLLEPEIADDVMMIIRARAAVLKLPISTVNPRSKRFDLPGLNAGASASWLTENAALPASAQTFQIAGQMVPRPIGGLVAISNRLLADAVAENQWAGGDVESVIKGDIADLIAVTMDSGLINGGSNAPTGILNTTGTTALSGFTIPTNGFSITSGTNTYGLLVAIVGTLMQQNMPFKSPGWLLNPRTLQGLLTLTDSMGRPLLVSAGVMTLDKSGASGTLFGYPFFTTGNVPVNMTYGTANNASAIIFSSDWEEAYWGNWQSLALDSSNEASYTPDGGTTWISAYQSQQTLTRATAWCDFTIRRPAAFCIVKGILP